MTKKGQSQTTLLAEMSEIAKRMKETPTLGTADPRYWVIQEKVWRAGIPDEDELRIFQVDSPHGMTPHEFLETVLEMACEEADDNRFELPVETNDESRHDTMVLAGGRFEKDKGSDPHDTNSWSITDASEYDIAEAIEDDQLPYFAKGQFIAIWGDWHYEDVPNTMFLTLEEAQHHMQANHYHYNQPRTYGRMAWRAPDVEKLWNAIKNIDWDELYRLHKAARR